MFRSRDPPNRYKNSTLIGNWFEERVLEKTSNDETEFGKYSLDIKGTKNFTQTNDSRQTSSLMKASLTYTPNRSVLRCGMRLMLANNGSNCHMAINTQDKRKVKFGASGSRNSLPIRRNVFQIKKMSKSPKSTDDDILRYGDKIRIITNERLLDGVQLALTSTLQQYNQPMTQSAYQELFFGMNENNDSVWKIENTDFEKRFKEIKDEVHLGEDILLRHCPTGKLMGVGGFMDTNQFGIEFELFAENIETKNKSHNLLNELVGLKGADLLKKDYCAENKWHFVGGKNEFDDFEDHCSNDEIKGLIFLEELVDRTLKTGVFTLSEIKNGVSKIDKKGDASIEKEDFFWTLKNSGIRITKEEFQILLRNFKLENGRVHYVPFFERFSVFVTFEKLEMIEVLLKKIVKNHPVLKFENLIKMFNGPSKGKDEVNRFVNSWGGKNVTEIVCESELRIYLEQTAACSRTDEGFCEFLRNFTA